MFTQVFFQLHPIVQLTIVAVFLYIAVRITVKIVQNLNQNDEKDPGPQSRPQKEGPPSFNG